MRDYLYTLTHQTELVTSILPIGDGVTVSTKCRNKAVLRECEDCFEKTGIIDTGSQS